MDRKTRYIIIAIIVIGLGLGSLGYFGLMEFIKNFPMNG